MKKLLKSVVINYYLKIGFSKEILKVLYKKGDKILKQMRNLTSKLQHKGYRQMVQKGPLSISSKNIYQPDNFEQNNHKSPTIKK